MQSKSASQGEANFYNIANSTLCTEPWLKGTGYNSFSHELMRVNASDSSSLEQSLDGQSQSDGGLNEEDEDTVKRSKDEDAVKTSTSTVPPQPGSDRIFHLEGMNLQQDGPTLQARPGENLMQPAQLELVSHSVSCASNPYDPYYGGMVAAAYGQPMVPHVYDMHHVRMPLPLEVAQEPVYVNAKQYHGILRRRQSRAKATLEKKLITSRKPYLHESRHQHAMRRARSSGGRFAKKSNADATSKGAGSSLTLSSQSTNSSSHESLFPNSTGSKASETQNLYKPDSGSYRKQANLQDPVNHTNSGKSSKGLGPGQQWGNIPSNRALAMQ